MATCAFFGNRRITTAIRDLVHASLVECIENGEVDTFYIGTHGDFDRIVTAELTQLQHRYPYIRCYSVLSRVPCQKNNDVYPFPTIVPEGLENTPIRYGIIKRNHWMIDHADVILTYISDTTGCSYRFAQRARKKGKKVISLA